MTVVAALATQGRITMAADTACNYQGTTIHGATKIRRLKTPTTTALVAAAGNGALVRLLPMITADGTTMPTSEDNDGDWNDWADQVATSWTTALHNTQPPLTLTTADNAPTIDGAYLLGAAGRLWYLFTHQALPVLDGIAALGSGAEYAFGSLHTTRYTELAEKGESEQRLRIAIHAACKYDPHCETSNGPQIETAEA